MNIIINQLKNCIWYFNYIKNNKKYFNNPQKKKNSEILVEFNAFQNAHIPLSYLSNILSTKYNSSINAFYNYSLISSPLKNSLSNDLKWKIGNFFSLKNFGIYRSFKVNKIFRPQFKIKNNDKINNYLKNTLLKIKSKKDVLKIKFDNVLVGDLIYDTYLKKFVRPTVDINSEEFYNLVKDFLYLYFFWLDYLNQNKVRAVIGVHTPYSYGLILRLAIYKKIPTYVTSSRFLYYLDKNMPYMHGHFKSFKKIFTNLKHNLKKEGLDLAKKRLQLRFKGTAGAKVDLISNEITSFSKNQKRKLILKSKKIKILIAPHDFFDAVHIYGNTLFADFYEWLIFLGKLSKKTNYDWYIKNRPNFQGKFQRYQPHTNTIIQSIVNKYPLIKLLPNDYSHHQIIKEKIDFVLTCYGSVGVEYPYFNIPVINASINNPHIKYKFNIHPKSVSDYERILLGLNKFKKKKLIFNKKEIYEYYFMRNIFTDKNWLIDDLPDMIKFVGGYDGQWKNIMYKYWIMNLTKKKHNKLIANINRFIDSKENFINIEHTQKIF